MKKKLLVLLSTMFLLAACGRTSSSKESSSSSTSSPSHDSSVTPVEPVKIDVTIKVTASGIEEYTGTHSNLYINSNFETSDWNTHVMSQDEENKDIWTYTFNQIEVDARYKFNIYYGGDETPDWANGINAEGSSENPLTVTISEEKTVYEFTSTFTVPTASYSFTLVLTPHIQTTEGTDDKMYDSTYLWMWCIAKDDVALEKQSDGTWTYKVSDYMGTKFQFTPCLGSESAINWSYQHGAYKDGTWEQWNSIDITLEEEKDSYSYDVYFNSQPDEVVGATYSITWHYNATSWDNLGSEISVCYTVNSGSLIWLKMNWDEQSNYNYTATGADIPSGATVAYHLYSWKADNDERYLAEDATGKDFSITVSSNLEYILTGEFGASAGLYGVGTATLVE